MNRVIVELLTAIEHFDRSEQLRYSNNSRTLHNKLCLPVHYGWFVIMVPVLINSVSVVTTKNPNKSIRH